ncbi:EexN family lipoprotein [Salmonella enterica]|nr:EexN family lipoprotein [Salmonella enterica]
MKKMMLITGFVLTLTGCGEETKSVDWWVSHPKETTEKYVDCQKTGSDSDNC